MHIEITYGDGSVELVPVKVEGFMVLAGRSWLPGHWVENPERCYFESDFFQCAIGEAGERQGTVDAHEDDADAGMEPFSWRLVGDEAEECRAKLSAWLDVLGGPFDPFDDIPPRLETEHGRAYRSDQHCWTHWLRDPVAELAPMIAERFPASGPCR